MLRVARELLGMSQDRLASELGLTARAVQRVEATNPSMSVGRQELFIEYFRKQRLAMRPPDQQHSGWSIIECSDHQERELPARLLRAARVGLAQSQAMLGETANLGTMTIRRIESEKASVEAETRQYLVELLISMGVHFLPPDGVNGWGIMFEAIVDEPKPQHPRPSVQRRKLERGV